MLPVQDDNALVRPFNGSGLAELGSGGQAWAQVLLMDKMPNSPTSFYYIIGATFKLTLNNIIFSA